MSAKVMLTGGNFQDCTGAVLANGYLTMKLSADEEVNDSLVCSGIEIRIQLDANGNVVSSPAQSVWGNDQLSPVNSFYKVTGYTVQGQIAFGPNNQQVIGSGGTFDVGSWVPNHVISWVPSPQPLAIEVVGTAFSSQTILDFVNTGNVIFTDLGNGQISASSSNSLALKVNGTPNSSQSVLNLISGKNVTITDGGSGNITFDTGNNIPSPDRARFSMFEAPTVNYTGGFAPIPVDDQLTTVDGGAIEVSVNPPDASNGASTTIQVIGGGFGHNIRLYQGLYWIYPGRKTTVRGVLRYRYDAIAAATEYFVGLSSNIGGANPTTSGDVLAIGFQKTAGNPIGNWILYTGASGSSTSTDTGIPAVLDQRYTFEIVVNSGVATASINGAQVATTSATLPVAPLGLMWYFHGSAGGGGGSNFAHFEYVYAENSTP